MDTKVYEPAVHQDPAETNKHSWYLQAQAVLRWRRIWFVLLRESQPVEIGYSAADEGASHEAETYTLALNKQKPIGHKESGLPGARYATPTSVVVKL